MSRPDAQVGEQRPARSPLYLIPNLLCVFRMLLVMPLLWLLFEGEYLAALALFVLAGFTDGLDGFLAKRCGWRTRLGALLDPAADKLLMTGVFVSLGVLGWVPVWLVVVVLARDLVIVSGAIVYRIVVGPFVGAARPASKLNTASQLLFVICAMSHAALGHPPQASVLVLGSTVFATAIVSGGDYVWSWGRRAWLETHGGGA